MNLYFRAATLNAGLAPNQLGLLLPRRKLPVDTLITQGGGSLPSVRCMNGANRFDACGQVMPVCLLVGYLLPPPPWSGSGSTRKP